MDKKIDDTETEKYKFHQYKRPISIDNIDFNKIVVSNKTSFDKKDFKYFIGYKDPKKLDVYAYFFYDEIWKKVSHIIKKEFDSKPAYNEKYIKTKIKSYNRKIKTSFHNNKIPKEDSQCICLSVILIDSVYKKDPQVFVECKYVVKEKKKSKFITDNRNFF